MIWDTKASVWRHRNKLSRRTASGKLSFFLLKLNINRIFCFCVRSRVSLKILEYDFNKSHWDLVENLMSGDLITQHQTKYAIMCCYE